MATFDEKAIENFIEYIRIRSVHPDPDYESCVRFLQRQAKELQLEIKIFRPVVTKPVVVISWVGSEPTLKSVLLNSHTDVVPVFEDFWKFPPFDGHMDDNGDIYGRGTQDMKCLAIIFIETIRRLKSRGLRLKRTVHMLFVPDEEINSKDGMAKFVKTDHFTDLNVGVAFDEGVVQPTQDYFVFYGEKTLWQIHVHCPGTPSHGSVMFTNSPGEKFRYIIDKFLDLRTKMKDKNGPGIIAKEDVTSINLTKIYGGVQENVVPDEMVAVFDLRICLSQDLVKFEELLNQWCKEAGEGVYIEFKTKDMPVPASDISDSNPFWLAFKSAADKLNLNLKTVICPGNTDSRFIRQTGIPSYGFTPINETPVLLHSHNEFINKSQLLKAINIFCEVLPSVANC